MRMKDHFHIKPRFETRSRMTAALSDARQPEVRSFSFYSTLTLPNFCTSFSSKNEKRSLPVYVRRLKTSLLKLTVLPQTANVTLYHMIRFFLNLSLGVHYFYTNISSFTPFVSIIIVLHGLNSSCFAQP